MARSRVMQLGAFVFADQPSWRFGSLRLDGWDGASGSSLQAIQKDGSAGAYADRGPQRTARVVGISGSVRAVSKAAMTEAFDALNAAADVDVTRLTVSDSDAGISRWADVQLQSDIATTPYSSGLVKRFALQLTQLDPRKFGDPLTTTVYAPERAGGLTIPFAVPFAIDSTVVSGQRSLANPGNAPGPVVLTVTGPATSPAVAHQPSGLTVWTVADYALGAGQTLEVHIDVDEHVALEQGTASRLGALARTRSGFGWPMFAPGVNTWALAATAFGAGAHLDITATPAWW